MCFADTFWILGLALLFELFWGDPKSAWHPVACFGRFSSAVESLCWRNHRFAGFLAWLLAIVIPLALIFTVYTISASSDNRWLAIFLQSLLLWSSLGWKSLLEHVQAVANSQSLAEEKVKVGYIVGRSTGNMDEQDVRRATIESLAENTSDAIIAPLFWFLIAGALGAWLYRMINTLDAMWGYKNKHHFHFGWFAAKTDDMANLIPARLTALFMLLQQPTQFSTKIYQQARQHQSPNAGFPETAMAFMLNIKLGGPVLRQEGIEKRAWMGISQAHIDHKHIQQGRKISHYCAITMALCIAISSHYLQ